MANEITVTTNLTVSNAQDVMALASVAKTFDQATQGSGDFSQTIGTTVEAIDFGDISPGWVRLRNLDTVNFCTWGHESDGLHGTLPASGGMALFYTNTGVVYVKANTSACEVKVTAITV